MLFFTQILNIVFSSKSHFYYTVYVIAYLFIDLLRENESVKVCGASYNSTYQFYLKTPYKKTH